MDTDLDTLATATYVLIDELLKNHPLWAPPRPKVGFTPKISDAEVVTLAVLQALTGHPREGAGSATPEPTWATCSSTCPTRAGTASGCGRWSPR